MGNIEKKMEGLFIATKNTKESQIKGELQLGSMNKKKNPSEMAQRIDKLENLVDRQEQYSWRICLLVHGIAETNGENTEDLVLKTINEKLDVNTTEKEIDRSHRIGRKKDEQRSRLIILE